MEKINKLETMVRKDECIVVFFPNMAEFNEKVLEYLTENSIDSELRHGGVIITNKSNVTKFKDAGFNFLLAKDMKELYSKYSEELKEYAQQVRRFYGLPEKNISINQK